MTHRYHVESSHVGCMPDGLATFATKAEALAFLKQDVEDLREAGWALVGSLKRGYFHDRSTFRVYLERCDDPRCEWEEA